LNAEKRGVLLPALAVTLVLALVAAAFLFYRLARFSEDPLWVSDAAADVPRPAERSKVIATAEQFALRMDNIDATDLEGYSKGVLEMLTTKGESNFREQFESLQKLEIDPKTKGEGRLLASGVANLDRDSASVLIAHDSATTTSKGATGRHHRWVVALQKIDGRWLVDDFRQID
jgi:Mce-associated membrane protein